MIIIKVMKDTKIWKSAAALLFAALLLPACSDDDGGTTVTSGDGYATLVVTIGSRDAATATTRATEDETVTEEEDDDYERTVQHWWLVVERESDDGSFVVDREVISSSNYWNLDGVTATTPSGEDSEWQVGLTVEIGQTYKFYALANLDYLANGEEIVNTIESLQAGDDFNPALLEAEMKSMDQYTSTSSTYIPMTSYGYEQYIDGTKTTLDDDIALIRLLGKVTLEIRNSTSSEIKLYSLKMGDFRSGGNIFLFPYDVDNDTATEYLLKDNIADEYAPTFPENATETFSETTFTSSETEISANGSASFSAYVNETGEGGSDFTITTSIPNRYDDPVASGFSFIRRNDWLKIPIQISDVTTKIEFDQQHMPIGGLPTSIDFGEISIPIATCTTTHAGDITITFTATSVNTLSNASLKFYTAGDSYTAGDIYTSAVLLSNTPETSPILIDVPTDNNAPWITDDDALAAYPLTQESNLSGSFTVTTQELATAGEAEIELTLVITGDEGELVIPYTIVITNQ